jgi:hypothetical protein
MTEWQKFGGSMRILTVVLIVASTGAAYAQQSPADGCRMYSDMAWSIMWERQKPVRMVEQLEVYAAYEGPMRETWNWMVSEAYRRGLEASADAKANVAIEFSNWVQAVCMDRIR